jgi:hypothetical protein
MLHHLPYGVHGGESIVDRRYLADAPQKRKEHFMIRRTVTLPEIALIAGTRAALGAGIGLLLAGRFDDRQRRTVGWTLFAVGAISTIPLAVDVLLGDEPGAAQDCRKLRSRSPREDLVSAGA